MNNDEQGTIFTPHLKHWVAILIALIIVFVLFDAGVYMFGGASFRHNVSSGGMPDILPSTASNPGTNDIDHGYTQTGRDVSPTGAGGAPTAAPPVKQLSDQDKIKILNSLNK